MVEPLEHHWFLYKESEMGAEIEDSQSKDKGRAAAGSLIFVQKRWNRF